MNQEINVFRSSAIFPIFINQYIDCKITFLSYWMIKKKIPEITCVYTVRSNTGEPIYKKNFLIICTKSYEISFRETMGIKNFKGSVEIEFFSSKNLIFPYPAVIINYIGNDSNAYVHSCGRIYNNYQDKIENNKMIVPESGFDILPDKIFKPFFSFVNGGEFLKNEKIVLHLINCNGKKLIKKIILDKIKPYETKFIFFLKAEEKKFFKGKRGTVRIIHNFKNFYPRFLSGNFTLKEDKVSLTHSYYDLSFLKNADEKWINPNKEIFYNPIVVFPFINKGNSLNEISIYPNFYRYSDINLNAELIDKNGKILINKKVLKISTKVKKIINLNFNKIFNEYEFEDNNSYFVRIFLNNHSSLPSRFKVSYNLSVGDDKPSANICFNAILPNKFIFKKKSTFKWCAIINPNTSFICLSNINFIKKKIFNAKIKMTIYSDNEKKKIVRHLKISNNGNLLLSFRNDEPVKKILKENTGWATFESDSPFLNGFYFDSNDNKFFAGDHLF